MRNLYIVNTPLHLFTAYILANYYAVGQENILAIINPKGYEAWANSRCLTEMCTDETTWKNVIVDTKDDLRIRLKSTGVFGVLSEFQDKLNSGGSIDQVYLASDKMLVNQIVVEMTGNKTYIRFDEGTASYVLPPERRVQSRIGEWLLVQTVRLFSGLRSEMKYNYSGLGLGEAGTADYLFKPHMLERPSPEPIAITGAAISRALDKIIPVMNDYEELSTGEIIIFLGSPLADRGKVDRDAELGILRRLSEEAAAMNYKVIYKTHHGECQEKLSYYGEQFPSMKFLRSVEPMEIILYRYSNIKALVTSVHSSAMLYADLFAKQEIRSISAARLLGWRPQPADHLIQKAGVQMPENFEEIRHLLTMC